MFSSIKSAILKFWRDEEGASGIEYALIAAMVAIILATFVTPISGKIKDIFTAISNALISST
ncbi:Flp/Fap pilin component [compost metagenome]